MNRLFALALICATIYISTAATPDNCQTPNADDTTCDACKTGYASNDGKTLCSKCTPSNCDECAFDALGTCTACAEGYGVKDTDGSCSSCKIANCAICTEDYEKCDSCDDGYADDSDACTACDNGCKECDKVDDSCDACPTGRVLNKTDTTAQFCCPTNCLECNSASFCTSCNTGFNLNSEKGTCFGFKTGASLTLGAIISVALFSLLF